MSAAPDPAAVAGGPERLPAPVRILADDLTGALDTAAMFARDGPVPVRLDSPAPDDDAAVSVVSTGTRDVPVQALASLLAPSIGWLAGAGIAFKKVDSLLRGNVLAEVAEVVRAGGFERVLFAPAFPAQGRLTVGGALQLAAQAVAGAPGSVGPAPSGPGPLADAFVALGLAAAVGDDALAALARGSGPCVLVPDARTDADLERLVALALSGPGRLLWCGSAGLAQALMRHAGRAPGMARSPGVGASPVLTVPGASPVLTVPGAFPALLIPGAAPVLPIPGAAPALPIPGASPASPIPGAAPALPIPGAAPASRPTTRSDAAAGPTGVDARGSGRYRAAGRGARRTAAGRGRGPRRGRPSASRLRCRGGRRYPARPVPRMRRRPPERRAGAASRLGCGGVRQRRVGRRAMPDPVGRVRRARRPDGAAARRSTH